MANQGVANYEMLAQIPTSYKRCDKKKYEIHVCKPPIGTCVINCLEQAHIVKQLNGKTYFTAEQMLEMRSKNPQMFQFLCTNAYVTNDKKPYVLSGTRGEMWTVSLDSLMGTYNFATGDIITPQNLLNRCYIGVETKVDNIVAVVARSNKTCSSVLKEVKNQDEANKIVKNSVMPWVRIQTKGSGANITYAMFVPKKYKFNIQTSYGEILVCNNPATHEHGKGDFIVCSALPNGQVDVNKKRVVNGAVFKDTYNNVGWIDCLDSSQHSELHVVMPTFELCKVTENDLAYGNNINNAYQALCVLVGHIKDRFRDNACRVYEDESRNYVEQHSCHIKVGGDNDDILRLIFRIVKTDKSVNVNVTGQSNHEKLDATWDFAPALRCTNLSNMYSYTLQEAGSNMTDQTVMEYYALSQKIWVRCRNALKLSPWRIYEKAYQVLTAKGIGVFNSWYNIPSLMQKYGDKKIDLRYTGKSVRPCNEEVVTFSSKQKITDAKYLCRLDFKLVGALHYWIEVMATNDKPDFFSYRVCIGTSEQSMEVLASENNIPNSVSYMKEDGHQVATGRCSMLIRLWVYATVITNPVSLLRDICKRSYRDTNNDVYTYDNITLAVKMFVKCVSYIMLEGVMHKWNAGELRVKVKDFNQWLSKVYESINNIGINTTDLKIFGDSVGYTIYGGDIKDSSDYDFRVEFDAEYEGVVFFLIVNFYFDSGKFASITVFPQVDDDFIYNKDNPFGRNYDDKVVKIEDYRYCMAKCIEENM